MMQVGQILVALGHLRSFMDIWLFCLLDKQFESIYLTCVTLKCQITPEIRLQCINGNSLILIPEQETYNQTKPVQNIFSTQLEIASYRTHLVSKWTVTVRRLKGMKVHCRAKDSRPSALALTHRAHLLVKFQQLGKADALFSFTKSSNQQLLVRRALISTRTQFKSQTF